MRRGKKLLFFVVVCIVIVVCVTAYSISLDNIAVVPVTVNGIERRDIVIGDNTAILHESFSLSTKATIFGIGVGDVSIILRGGRYTGDGGNEHILYHDVSWTLGVTEGGFILFIEEVTD